MVLAASAAIVNAKDTCNALVLSGGGSNGAWEVGVMWGLLHYGNPGDYEWDWMTGVSAGSINTAAMSGWAIGDDKTATEWLSCTITTLTSDQIWVPWTKKEYLTNEPGLFNDAPAVAFMESALAQPQFKDGYKRNFTIAAENIETGEYIAFTRDNVAFGAELA